LIVLTCWIDAWLGLDFGPLVEHAGLTANLGDLDSDSGNTAWIDGESHETETKVGAEVRTNGSALITSKSFVL